MSTTSIATRDATPKEMSKTTHKTSLSTPVDVFENAEEYLVVADLPGARKDGLGIAYHENELRIHAAVQAFDGDFEYRRILTIGSDILPEKIAAELDKGVLRVHLPKSDRAKPREIPVSVG